MSQQKNETLILIVALLITGGLLAVGYFAFRQWQSGTPENIPDSSQTSPSQPSPRPDAGEVAGSVSRGDRLLVASQTSAAKRAGIEAFAAGDYDRAIAEFEASLQDNRNDPETLIYLNNARIGDRKAYTIAAAVPASTSENAAQEMLRGVAQAQNEVNEAGGIGGVPLRVVVADDANSPEAVKKVAASLVEESDVLGVVGHFGSDVTLAAAPVYEEGELVAITPTSTSVELSTAGDYIFRTVPSDRFTGNALAKYTVEGLNLKEVAVFYNAESNYSRSLKDELTTALYGDGGEVVAEFDLAAPDFNAFRVLEEAKQRGAEVIVLAANTETLDPALQVVRANRGELPVLGGDSLYKPETLKVGGDSEDMVVAVPWHVMADPSSEFPGATQQLWGGDVNWRTAMAYDATEALIAALAEDPTRRGVQEVLSDPGFSAEGATGTIRFLASGDRNQAVTLVRVEPGRRSGFGYDFVPVSEGL
ncbi:MAG: ABC transporter substrate-binding protein [Limnospira sp.]